MILSAGARFRSVLLTLALLLAGCGRDNSLSGSVGELFSLEVSRVEVLRNSEALQISYYNNRGPEIDLVIRVTVAIGDLDIRNGRSFALEGEYQPGHQRTAVIHLAGGEPVRNLPPVKKGDMEISSGGGAGQSTRGNFSMLFDQGGDLGANRTLSGRFSAVAQDAGFGP